MPNERKSTRLAKATMKASLESGDDMDDSDSEFDEDELLNKNQGPAVKRKASGKTSTRSSKKQPPKKKFKGMRGLLSNVVDMPMDILFEIFGNLLPIDLWNLARTSKDLRSILMSSTSAFVWREARKNDPHQLPDCPSEMSEPEFAALCYAKHCTTCLRVTPSPYHIWAERVRLCRKCVNAECEEFPPDLPTELFDVDVLPWVLLPGREPNVVYKAALNSLRTTIQKLKKSGREWAIFSSDLVKQMKQRERHARECEEWFRRRQDDIEAEKGNIINQRRAEVMAYVKQLGWSDELLNSFVATAAIRECSTITKACHKKITEQVLTGLEQFLNTFFGDLEIKYAKWKTEKMLKDRLPLLRNVRNECAAHFSLDVPVITTRDLFHVPEVRSLIVDTPFSTTLPEIKKLLEPVSQQFHRYVEEWQNKQKESLRKMVGDAHGPEYVMGIEGDILNLATTFFDCKNCLPAIIWPARAMVHYHSIESTWGYGPSNMNGLTEERKTEVKTAASVLRQRQWNDEGHIAFDKSRSTMLGEVIRLCGFDPKATTVEEMNDADPILECLACNSVYKGRTLMKWSRTVRHCCQAHGNRYGYNPNPTKMKLRVVDGPDLPFIQLQLNHMREKTLSAQGNKDSFCARCRHEGNLPDLKTHWKEVHKEPVGDGCILRKLDTSDEVDEYILWPPLEPEELASAGGTEITLNS